MSLWLEPSGEPTDVERRTQWWVEREATLEAEAPNLIFASPRPPEVHGRVDSHLPVRTLRAEVHGLLLTWFGDALARLSVDLSAGALGQARSWLEVRDALPSAERAEVPSRWVASLSDVKAAHDLCFELFASPAWGAGLGRYPERIDALVERTRGRASLRVWDAGCATGEGTLELACALATGGVAVTAVGTTPWPLERLMAERRERPHDPEGSVFPDARGLAVDVGFLTDDLRSAASDNRRAWEASYDVVACHGVLGGSLRGDDAQAAMRRLVAAVAPGGLLSVTDRFREDRQRERERLLSDTVGLGLRRLDDGLLERVG